MVNPTKVTEVAVLLTLRNLTQVYLTMVIMTAVLYTAQSLTQLHQTGQKSSLKGRDTAVAANRTSELEGEKANQSHYHALRLL